MKINPLEEEPTPKEGPPSLNYDLRARTTSNIIFWSSIVVTLTVLPIIIYYPLTYLTNLSIGTILGLSSISNGLPNFISLFHRLWKLWKYDGGDRRPLSGKLVDLFMCEYICSFIIIAACYTVSTSIPVPQLFLMTPSVLVGLVGSQFFFSLLQLQSPIWVSSLPPGHKMRPAAYYIMEDIVAVDGAGRSAFRRDLNTRYESSLIFRQLVYEMTAYWASAGIVFIGVSAAFTFATHLNFAFAATLIWIPIWACSCALMAYFWIQHRLMQEIKSFQNHNNLKNGIC